MALWAVRCGSLGEHEDQALEKGKLALDFNNTIDLTNVQTRNALKDWYSRIAPEATPNQINNWAGQLWNFKDSIKVGDLVVMPRKGNREFFAIGEIVGEYEYHSEQPSHKRAVTWISPAVRRDLMEQGLLKSLTSDLTVFMPNRQRNAEAEQRLRAVAEGWMFPPRLGDSWDEFVKRAKAYVANGRLESEEIEYKVKTGRELAEAREAVLTGEGGWASLVKHGVLGNLMNRFSLIRFRDWIDNFPQDALRAIKTVWTEDDWSAGQRVRAFTDLFPAKATEISGAGTRMNVISVLLMALDVYQYPPFKLTVFDEAYERTGYTRPEQDADEAALYEHALGFLDRFIDEAAKRGLTLRHRLDAQSVVWAIKDTYEEPPEPSTEPWELEKRPPLINPWSPENIAALAKELLWEPVQLQQIVDDLQDKRQVIFYGPPGTGKTYVAREIAKKCRLNGGDFEIVQFHPSYSYEDFVEGFRPKLIGGQPGFELVHGPLRRIADKAKDNESATYILVIDELNRGNVAKVFGELYFLLEYRNEPVRLQYGRDGEGFSLPSNLWFICTMNTADRSIALMDAALRRRFYFAAFFPNEPPIRGLLRRWLNKQEQATLAADLIDQANQNLDRDAGIGPSYFMRPNQFLSEDSVRRIWERAVVPYVEEQCFGDEAKLQTFGFDALKRQIGGSELAVTPGESIAEQASNADSATN